MKINKTIKCIFFLIFLFSITNNGNIVQAKTFTDASYTSIKEYSQVINRVIASSNKQGLEVSKIIAKWERLNPNTQEQYEDIDNYIENAKKEYVYLSDYNDEYAKEVKKTFDIYIDRLNIAKDNIGNFIDGPIIFSDFLKNSSTGGETYNNYFLFKNNALTPFLNSYIYNNNVRIAIRKLSDTSTKNEGVETLRELIKNLEKAEENTNNDKSIRNFASVLIDHYTNLINDNHSYTQGLLIPDKYRVEGLLVVGYAYDNISEFNSYVLKFNDFSDFPSIELAGKLDSKKLSKMIKNISKTNVTTAENIELKKKHYELLYQISEYKKTNNIDALYEAYNDFFQYYHYLDKLNATIQNRFGQFSSSIVISEINSFKENSNCIDYNNNDYTNIQYNPNVIEDTNSYREFAISKISINSFKNIIILMSTLITFCFIGFIIFKIKNKQTNNEFYDYDNYYTNNNWSNYNNWDNQDW